MGGTISVADDLPTVPTRHAQYVQYHLDRMRFFDKITPTDLYDGAVIQLLAADNGCFMGDKFQDVNDPEEAPKLRVRFKNSDDYMRDTTLDESRDEYFELLIDDDSQCLCYDPTLHQFQWTPSQHTTSSSKSHCTWFVLLRDPKHLYAEGIALVHNDGSHWPVSNNPGGQWVCQSAHQSTSSSPPSDTIIIPLVVSSTSWMRMFLRDPIPQDALQSTLSSSTTTATSQSASVSASTSAASTSTSTLMQNPFATAASCTTSDENDPSIISPTTTPQHSHSPKSGQNDVDDTVDDNNNDDNDNDEEYHHYRDNHAPMDPTGIIDEQHNTGDRETHLLEINDPTSSTQSSCLIDGICALPQTSSLALLPKSTKRHRKSRSHLAHLSSQHNTSTPKPFKSIHVEATLPTRRPVAHSDDDTDGDVSFTTNPSVARFDETKITGMTTTTTTTASTSTTSSHDDVASSTASAVAIPTVVTPIMTQPLQPTSIKDKIHQGQRREEPHEELCEEPRKERKETTSNQTWWERNWTLVLFGILLFLATIAALVIYHRYLRHRLPGLLHTLSGNNNTMTTHVTPNINSVISDMTPMLPVTAPAPTSSEK